MLACMAGRTLVRRHWEKGVLPQDSSSHLTRLTLFESFLRTSETTGRINAGLHYLTPGAVGSIRGGHLALSGSQKSSWLSAPFLRNMIRNTTPHLALHTVQSLSGLKVDLSSLPHRVRILLIGLM